MYAMASVHTAAAGIMTKRNRTTKHFSEKLILACFSFNEKRLCKGLIFKRVKYLRMSAQRKMKQGNRRYQQKSGKKKKKKEETNPSILEFIASQWDRFARLPMYVQSAIVFIIVFNVAVTLFTTPSSETDPLVDPAGLTGSSNVPLNKPT